MYRADQKAARLAKKEHFLIKSRNLLQNWYFLSSTELTPKLEKAYQSKLVTCRLQGAGRST